MVLQCSWNPLFRPPSILYVCQLTLPRPSYTYLAPRIISFSTTVIRRAERSTAPPRRGTNTLRISKKTPVRDKGRPPGIGERKASRKRIVLSNSNALEVNLPIFDTKLIYEMLAKPMMIKVNNLLPKKTINKKVKEERTNDNQTPVKQKEEKQELIGHAVTLSNKTVDSLRAIEAFKITQSWPLFRNPSMLIREESKILTEKLVEAQELKTTMRLVIDGAKGSGKSMMLLHAMATAFVNDWLVIHIPEAQDVTNAATEYAPIIGSNLFSQNVYSAELLSKIAKANSNILSSMIVKQEHPNLPAPLESGCSVYRLCELGAREPESAWPFFLAFWSEITAKDNPPVLMCLDGLSHICQNSLYVRPDLSYIHSHDLAIVRHFIEYLSGVKTIPNGGAFIAATNKSHSPVSPSLELAIKRSLERKQSQPESKPDPYEKKYDSRTDNFLANIDTLRLGGLSKSETRGLLEYWAKSGVLRSRIDERTVTEKWVLAGHGNAGEIERGSLWMRV